MFFPGSKSTFLDSVTALLILVASTIRKRQPLMRLERPEHHWGYLNQQDTQPELIKIVH
jgi:hypothetical protein